MTLLFSHKTPGCILLFIIFCMCPFSLLTQASHPVLSHRHRLAHIYILLVRLLLRQVLELSLLIISEHGKVLLEAGNILACRPDKKFRQVNLRLVVLLPRARTVRPAQQLRLGAGKREIKGLAQIVLPSTFTIVVVVGVSEICRGDSSCSIGGGMDARG